MDIFSGHILFNRDGDKVDPEEALQNKIVGLYFSNGSFSSCKEFATKLADFYSAALERSALGQFEIIFISSDKTEDDMVEHMNLHGDWLSLPWHDSFKYELWSRFQITALPKLVIVKPNGDVITYQGRKEIKERGIACLSTWLDGADVFQNFKGL
uniref:Thioredoxin-like fold domain-containing protein n=1 Tax=Leptobrachium leishanense TaxID=445787 RepID=A0A8C5LMT4_9ANUR